MNPFRRLWYSVAGVRYYPALVGQGLRQPVGYLLALIVIVVAIRGLTWYRQIDWTLRSLSATVSTWPDFRLADGRFTFNGEMPYTFSDESITAIIDTTGNTGPEALDTSLSSSNCLLTASHFYFKNLGQPVRKVSWADLPFQTGRNKLANVLPNLTWPVLAVAVIWLLVSTIFLKTLHVLLLGLVGWLATGARDLRYSQACTVAIHALTAPIILALAKDFYRPDLPGAYLLTRYFYLIYWGLAMIWVILASRTVRADPGAPQSAAAVEETADYELLDRE